MKLIVALWKFFDPLSKLPVSDFLKEFKALTMADRSELGAMLAEVFGVPIEQ